MKFLFSILIVLISIGSAQAFPDFQKEIGVNKYLAVDCAYCHVHPNGPSGNAVGQIGSLSEIEKTMLASMQDESIKQKSKSPILNAFGNHIIDTVGYSGTLDALADFQAMLEQFKDSDFDTDGISDMEEMLDGTLADDKLDGNAFKLFIINSQRHAGQLILWLILCLALSFGFYRMAKERE